MMTLVYKQLNILSNVSDFDAVGWAWHGMYLNFFMCILLDIPWLVRSRHDSWNLSLPTYSVSRVIRLHAIIPWESYPPRPLKLFEKHPLSREIKRSSECRLEYWSSNSATLMTQFYVEADLPTKAERNAYRPPTVSTAARRRDSKRE